MANTGKFGRKRPYPEWVAPRLYVEDFLDFGALPAPMGLIDFHSHVHDYAMLLNDQLGDCTAAALLHIIQSWTDYASVEFDPTDAEALKIYEVTGGYIPGDPSTDNGAVVQDVLDYWRKTGVNGHKIVAFAKIQDPTKVRLRQALQVFGTVYLGIECPSSALDQFNADEPWTVVPGSPIAGGHAIALAGWNMRHSASAVVLTWGKAQHATGEFLETYTEEAWVPISEDWINAQGVTPVSGLNMQQLSEDFTLLTGKPGPFPGARPVVVVPPSAPEPVTVPSFWERVGNWIIRIFGT
jgi:hypothetical protein